MAIAVGLALPAHADPYRATAVILPDGKKTLAVFEAKTGRVWILSCPATCFSADPIDQNLRRRGISGEDAPFMEPLRYRLPDGALGLTPDE